ncbi:MAG: DNA polymerase IV [Thaumarchaeota archaeon]|nr:DNA polymerase IV [Nitrososphaerota archaeon]
MERVIAHIDIDYFYAQVEEVENPALRERPVAVCVFSGRTEDSGVVATANYRARELGVSSGMPIALARRKLEGKDPVMIRMDHAKYEVISERVMQILRAEADVLEQTGIDEAFLDLTKRAGSDYEAARATAEGVKRSVFDGEHLTCSVGIGRSKVVAKLASDKAKPGGIVIVPPDATMSFMKDLPVADLYGVGPKSSEALRGLGIGTIGELAACQLSSLEKTFGRKFAVYLHDAANGADADPVTENKGPSQLMRVITLKQNTTDAETSMEQLAEAVADLRRRLQSQNLSFRTVTAIAILTDLSTKTRSKTFETPIDDLSIVESDILDLFEDLSGSVDREFRRVGIRVSDLRSDQDQSSLSEFLQPAK